MLAAALAVMAGAAAATTVAAARERAAGAAAPTTPGAAATRAAATRAAADQPIDINSASRTRLKTLPGIGDAEADRIVAQRPYLSKADLVSRDVLPAGVYQAIRHKIVAVQKASEHKKRRASPSTPATNAKG